MAELYKSDGMGNESKPTELINRIQHGGHVRMDVCKFTAPAALAVGDKIELFRLPARSKLLLSQCYIASAATVSLKLVGYTGGVAASAHASLAAAGTALDTAVETTGKVLVAEVTSGTPAADSVIYFGIAYVTSVG